MKNILIFTVLSIGTLAILFLSGQKLIMDITIHQVLYFSSYLYALMLILITLKVLRLNYHYLDIAFVMLGYVYFSYFTSIFFNQILFRPTISGNVVDFVGVLNHLLCYAMIFLFFKYVKSKFNFNQMVTFWFLFLLINVSPFVLIQLSILKSIG